MIVTAERVFPVSSPPFGPGGVAVTAGRIAGVAATGDLLERHPNEERCHFPGCVLLPGLVNAHTHLEYTAFAHLARPTDFLDWIRRLKGQAFTDPPRKMPFWEASASEGARCALAAGTTTVGDVVTFGSAPAAAARSGLRMRAFVEAVGVDPGAEAGLVPALEARLDAAVAAGSLVSPGLSPHSVYTLSPAALEAVGALASRRGVPLAVHLGETHFEAALLRGEGPLAAQIERFGLPFGRSYTGTLAGYLETRGALSPRTVIVHGGCLGEADLTSVRAAGASLVACLRSNRMLRAGEPDLALWERAGVPFACGTDSLASVPDLDLFAEARALRERSPGEAVSLLRRLTLGGAGALGLDGVTGSLEEGKAADLVLLRLEDAPTAGEESVVAGGCAAAVAATMVDGVFRAWSGAANGGGQRPGR